MLIIIETKINMQILIIETIRYELQKNKSMQIDPGKSEKGGNQIN